MADLRIRAATTADVPAIADIVNQAYRHYILRSWLGGLLQHAAAATASSTPTINGYKRYMPNSMAPDHIVWAYDNRAAMVRVVGQPGDASTRLENRVGEPAANPYLYMASRIAAGLDGVATAADPGPSADTPHSADAPMLPKSR